MPSIPDPKSTERGTDDYTPVYEQLGVVLSTRSGPEAMADACPFCGREKFSVKRSTGQYQCFQCKEKGNVQTFLTWFHGQHLEATTDAHYRQLKDMRGGISLQTLKRHELAYDAARGQWLIPFKNRDGKLLVNLQRYVPSTGKKYNLPRPLSTSLFNLHRLSSDRKKILFLCEGPFDAIALDHHLGLKRAKYDILAIPVQFQECWAEYLKGRKVRALFDNDNGGKEHGKKLRDLVVERIVEAEDVRLLRWPEGFKDGCDINDLVRDPQYKGLSIPGWSEDNCTVVKAERKLQFQFGKRRAEEDREIEWIWPDRIPCGTYASFSGRQGSFKSSIMQEIAARHTRGERMPLCERDGVPPGHVLYVYAEDDRSSVENGFEWAGGDFDRWIAMPAIDLDGDQVNVLKHLEEIEETVREHNIRLVVLDGQNSLVGNPNIGTDMQARTNVSNKLHQFAQKLNVCLIGVRNEADDGRPMGPQSFADIGRCVFRAVEDGERGVPPYCKLVFVKVSGVARECYPDIPFSAENLGGARRKILWGKEKPKPASCTAEEATLVRAALDAGRARKAGRGRGGLKEKPYPKNHT